jgi:2',3'-cyclic-nucleotide 2'-phosphodiesterase (5'-nucleotidase family)
MEIISFLRSAFVGLASKARARLASAALLAALAVSVGCRQRQAVSPAASPAPSTAAAADAALPGAQRGREIALLYSSNLQGKYAPCNCAVQPLGGLARRATVTARARAEADATLVVDAGDLFLPEGSTAETERQANLLAAGITSGGIDAFTPGEGDLAIGVPLLKKVTAAFKIPVVSANLYGRDGQRLFAADRLVDAGGTKIGIFGVTAPPTVADANRWRADGIVVHDPADAARESAAALRARGAQIIVALVHAGLPAENRRLVAKVFEASAPNGVEWAVLGHSALNLESPEPSGGARLLEAQSEGKRLGRLDLHVVNGAGTFVDRDERAEIASILADHRRQLQGGDRTLGELDPASAESYYQQRRSDLGAAIARETALLARLPAQITGSWFENHIIPLDRSIPDDPVVVNLVRGYLARGLAEKRRPHL